METRIHATRRVRQLGGGSLVLEVEGPIPETRPGQFYMLRTADRWPVLLPRPFSLYDRGQDGEFGGFLIKAVGPGTETLASCRPGDEIWLTGPLGQSFREDIEAPVCIAGGVGLAPFLLLAQRYRDLGREPIRLLFGGRDTDALAGREDFEGLARMWTSTDDGSHGYHGLVTGLLEDLLAKGEVRAGETVFCCGPDPMMHAVADLCKARGLPCYLSLENYMACGYGVCNGCTVEVVPERFRGWPYSRACQEGPVYDAQDLVL